MSLRREFHELLSHVDQGALDALERLVDRAEGAVLWAELTQQRMVVETGDGVREIYPAWFGYGDEMWAPSRWMDRTWDDRSDPFPGEWRIVE